MPLEIVPDLLDDDAHNKLDRAVEKTVDDDSGGVSDLSTNLQYTILINAIVAHGKDMDRKFLDLGEAKNLIKTQGELSAMLASAWRRRSYREIRNLGAWLQSVVPLIQSLTIFSSLTFPHSQPFSEHRKKSRSHQCRYPQY